MTGVITENCVPVENTNVKSFVRSSSFHTPMSPVFVALLALLASTFQAGSYKADRTVAVSHPSLKPGDNCRSVRRQGLCAERAGLAGADRGPAVASGDRLPDGAIEM